MSSQRKHHPTVCSEMEWLLFLKTLLGSGWYYRHIHLSVMLSPYYAMRFPYVALAIKPNAN